MQKNFWISVPKWRSVGLVWEWYLLQSRDLKERHFRNFLCFCFLKQEPQRCEGLYFPQRRGYRITLRRRIGFSGYHPKLKCIQLKPVRLNWMHGPWYPGNIQSSCLDRGRTMMMMTVFETDKNQYYFTSKHSFFLFTDFWKTCYLVERSSPDSMIRESQHMGRSPHKEYRLVK